MKKTLIAVSAVVALLAAVYFYFTVHERHRFREVRLPENITWLKSGLSKEQQEIWHHLSEGSEMLPMSILEALRQPATGRPFIECLTDYGFLAERSDPLMLPVGWTSQIRVVGDKKVPFIGINCAACHSGELRYRNQTVRIDGAPNMFALEKFLMDVDGALMQMRTNRQIAFHFVRDVIQDSQRDPALGRMIAVSPRVLKYLEKAQPNAGTDVPPGQLPSPVSGAAAVAPHEHEDLITEIVAAVEDVGSELRRRIDTFHILRQAVQTGVPLGPGRGDSFGIIRNLLFPENPIQLNAPVSTPHLFNMASYHWLHWDGNTTSTMERNIAQAIALGADYDPSTARSSVLPRNLRVIEGLARRLKSPAWPENIFGKIDRGQADRGRLVYQDHCGRCHDSEQMHPADEVGTSPFRARNFEETVGGRPFPELLKEKAARARMALFDGFAASDTESGSSEPTNSVWRSTGGYVARPLAGVWATAPFLHNGSVPTLYHLLLPAVQRPVRFPVGSREFDPQKLGFDLTGTNAAPTFVLDTTLKGNGNMGHEYGVHLPEDSRMALLEYLKTL